MEFVPIFFGGQGAALGLSLHPDVTCPLKPCFQSKVFPKQHCLCMQGFVYVKFGTQEAASAAQRALDGRWFAGRQICAEYQFTAVYSQHFSV